MIDVIIPAYNAHKTIDQTLFSIAYQSIDKINVYIVNDNSNENYEKQISFFSEFMNIKELKLKKNMGPGYARQYGIDNSKSKYIVFIDSDDVFSDPFALENLLYTITKNDSDIGITDFVEQHNNSFLSHSNDTIWLHGKIYKRKFLEKYNIHFNNTRANEDNGFNQLMILSGAKINSENIKTYIWIENKESITRKNNNEYVTKGINGYFCNMLYALNGALKNNGDIKKISEFAFSVFLASYYYYIQYPKYFEDNNLFLDIIKIKEICDNYCIDEDRKIDLMEQQFEHMINEENKKSFFNPIMTFNQYLEMLKGMEKND